MIGHVIKFGLAIAVVSAATGGCAGPVEGEATNAPVPEVTEVTFHPCDGLSPEAIRVAKLDAWPLSRRDRKNPTSLACFYQSNDPTFGISIAALDQTLQRMKDDDRFTTLDEIEIGGRPTLIVDWKGGRACEVAVEITPGTLDFMVGYGSNARLKTPEAACKQALEVVNILEPYFPEHL